MSLLELHFLGTGTSGCLPAISCLTDRANGCDCCISTTRPGPEGKKNVRRNTSAVLRVKPHGSNTREEDVKTILIDCGKSFLTSALEWFPQKGFRRIDALIITHPHSDAMSGLDDLRGWTLGGAIQDTMDIYTTQSTFQELERTYPYLVSAHLATGGGDVPAMNYKIFDESRPFEVCGIKVTPLPVHHGIYFTKKEPYYCLGFLFNRALAYISDVSYIPEETWRLLEGVDTPAIQVLQSGGVNASKASRVVKEEAKETLTNGDGNGNAADQPVPHQGRVQPVPKHKQSPPPILIIDCLRVYPHTSHFGFGQAIATARRLGPSKTYMMGYAHRVLHSTWQAISLAVEQGERPKHPPKVVSGGLQAEAGNLSFGAFNPKMRHSEDPAELKEIALSVMEEWEGGPKEPLWTRPAYDGLALFVDERTGECWDDA